LHQRDQSVAELARGRAVEATRRTSPRW
jgi:hypothetical protein